MRTRESGVLIIWSLKPSGWATFNSSLYPPTVAAAASKVPAEALRMLFLLPHHPASMSQQLSPSPAAVSLPRSSRTSQNGDQS